MPKILKQIFSARMLVVLLLGFSSGLPLALTGGTLKAWATEAGVNLTTMGWFSYVGLPYTLKFLWAPFADRFSFPGLGRRRGWLLVTQAALIASLGALAFSHPTQTFLFVGIAFAVAFFSATQDIIIDAYRREILDENELGLGSSLSTNGYRVAMWVSQAGALAIAQYMSWQAAYLAMAGCVFAGVVTALFAKEPNVARTPRSFADAVVSPFKDFFGRKQAFLMLAFILLFKAGDSLASEWTMPFYLQLGFEKVQIAKIVKTFGLVPVFLGLFLGGLFMLRLGIYRSLWVFGALQAISTFGFSLLAKTGPNEGVLAAVVAFENLTGGMGTAAYIAYMASLTNRRFTATQYALLTSLMGVPRVFLGSLGGALTENVGWELFFVICTLIAIPGMLLLLKVAPWNGRPDAPAGENSVAKTA